MSSVNTSLTVLRGLGVPLAVPASLQNRLGEYFNVSLGGLNIMASAAPKELDAYGFAVGETVFIDPEFASLETSVGIGLLVHEITHVLQQRRFLFHDMIYADGLIRIDRADLEAEANDAAMMFLRQCSRFTPSGGIQERRPGRDTSVLQCQATGTLNTHYLDGGTMNPAGGAITFSAVNSMNEVYTTRVAAFTRAKALLGFGAGTAAKRTYHWYLGGGGIALGEGTDINGGTPAGVAANQRTGRYYDFGRGKLIVDHPDDPNSTTAVGGGGAVHRGHFHIASYEVKSGNQKSMYLLHGPGYGAAPVVANQPPVYAWDRRFSFELNGGAVGHHIYYH